MYGFTRAEATRKKVRLRWFLSAFKVPRITMDIQIDLMMFFYKNADSVLWLKNWDSFAFLCISEEEEEKKSTK